MQVVKGGWVGQPFALAKLNDSSGAKKSKNRHSKEERKGMAETFIKRYQSSNNGSFPSLRLTQKEVGGSFYTVREIFREIIQENRVLAPPKLPPGEQNTENLDSFLEQCPLGSVSINPQVHEVPSKDTQTLLNEYEFRREKVLNSRKITELHRGSLENENIINGSVHKTVKNEESKDPRFRELLVKRVEEGHNGEGETIDAESSDATVSSEEFDEPKHTELEGLKDEVKELEVNEAQIRSLSEDIVVETFPLRPALTTVDNVEEKTSEKEVLDGNLELVTGKDDSSTQLVDAKSEELVSPLPESKPIEIVTTQNNLSTDEHIVLDVNTITDVKLDDTLPAESKASSSPNNISPQNLDGNHSSSSLQKSTFEKTNANTNKSDIPLKATTQRQTVGSTLNRINLSESWEAAESEKSNNQETNPIVSFIKSLVTAFVKFWSE